MRYETAHDGLVSTYQYAAYPRFRLLINEHLSMYKMSRIFCANFLCTYSLERRRMLHKTRTVSYMQN